MAAPKKETPPTEAPKGPKLETAEEARERAQKCGEAVQKVLDEYRCEIVAQIGSVDPVGNQGDKVQLSAIYGFVPR